MSMNFYLGRNLSKPSTKAEFKAADLTTHALCFGMTGSGKTGLCLAMLEEASRKNIPVIAIDPKGDLANICLSWPDFDPARFTEWIEPSQLQESGEPAQVLGKHAAERWKEGLEADGIAPSDIDTLRAETSFQVFTPGSTAGIPVSVLERFDAPEGYTSLAAEDQSELIQGSVEAVLGLVGVAADPIRSREAILLSTILSHAWNGQKSLSLSELIIQIGAPPFSKLGVFALEDFFPEKDRRKLAMKLNGLVASPSFAHWLAGEPLDVGQLLTTAPNKSQTSIFSVAHLDDDERTSFITLLLQKILAWVRGQPGSTSLRAILFFDEVFGAIPPHPKNPSTKKPLLTLLKQARAFGLGVVLATQNPVDIDYKAITNAGTWFVGRLQTEQDRARIIDGLLAASAQSGETLNRAEVERTIGSLGPREFLLQSIHHEALQTFKSRFAMSYLRGPLTRRELSRLKKVDFYNPGSATQEVTQPQVEPAPVPPKPSAPAAPSPPPAAVSTLKPASSAPPVAEPQVLYPRTTPDGPTFLDAAYLHPDALRQPIWREALGPQGMPRAHSGAVTYRPALWISTQVRWTRGKSLSFQSEVSHLVFPIPSTSHTVSWDVPIEGADRKLISTRPIHGATFEPCPQWLFDRSRVALIKKAFSEEVRAASQTEIPYSKSQKTYGHPGESLLAFRHRVGATMRPQASKAISEKTAELQMHQSHFENKLRETREWLEMDQRELKQLKASGANAAKMANAREAARVRLESYKELKSQRDRVLQQLARERADVEFNLMDTLVDCTMFTLKGKTSAKDIRFFGLLWIPDR